LNLRDKTEEDFNALITQFAIERFLYRLALFSAITLLTLLCTPVHFISLPN
jgi:hypothetical protein